MKRTLFTRCCAIILAAGLAACSGGGSPSALPAAAGAAGGATGGSLQITIPFASGSSAASKSPAYVSSGTQSVKIVANPNAGCNTCTVGGQTIVANLNAANPNCTAVANGLSCTVAFTLSPGAYTLGVSTYSGVVSGGNPGGTLLSTNQSVALTIVSGANTVVTATLNGVPVSFDQDPTQGALIKSSLNNYYHAEAWNAPMTISIIARDAAGAAIIGPGAPAYSATFNNAGNNWTNVAINGGTITATSPNYRQATLVINASATSPSCLLLGAVCAATMNINMDQEMAVASRPNNTVMLYTLGVPNTPIATITSGVSGPTGVLFDLAGDLFVLNEGNNTVTEYAPPYTGAPIATLSTGISTPQSMALDRLTADLAVSNFGNNTVAVFTPPYTGAPGIVSSGIHQPAGVAFDPTAGDLFVANGGNNTVTGYPAPFANQTATTTITQGINAPFVLFFRNFSGGDLYVGVGGAIQQYHRPLDAAAPALTLASTAAAPVSKPYTIVYSGTTNQLIEADPFAQRVNIYPINSAIATTSLGISPNPQCAILDGDANINVCNYAFTEIQSYALPYTGSPTATYFQGLGGTDAVALFP
jgi:hypothetical protein